MSTIKYKIDPSLDLYSKAVISQYMSSFQRTADGNCGIDLYAARVTDRRREKTYTLGDTVRSEINDQYVIDTGVSFDLTGKVGLVMPRSSTFRRTSLKLNNQVGVIDSNYRGNIILNMTQPLFSNYMFPTNKAIAQIVILDQPEFKLEEQLTQWESTDRGENGFGSTDEGG